MARLVIGFMAFALILAPVLATTPAAEAQCSLAQGAVIQLVGTPHLFIADEVGVLHWGGDTRGLAGRYIDWSNRCNLTLNQLLQTRRGDPWLSSGLPKIGIPIYLSKWEDDEAQPRLLHIQNIPDVELFGINEANYGNFIMDRATWEGRYGFNISNLQIGPLASGASYALPDADRAAYAQLLMNLENVESATFYLTQQQGRDAAAVLPPIADCEQQALSTFNSTRQPSTALQGAQTCLNQVAGGSISPTPGTGVPSTPTNLRVTVVGANTLRLTWDDVANETGYRIYGGDQVTPNNTLVMSLNANTTTFDIGNRTAGVTYCYTVTAFNQSGESPAQSPVCANVSQTGGLPSAPVNLQASMVSQNIVQLSWADVSTNEDGFRIRRGDQSVLATLPANTTSYTDSFANVTVPGVTDCYTVAAFNSFGEAPSAQVCAGGTGVPGAPVAPTGLQVSVPTSTSVNLFWSDLSNNEQGFYIYEGNTIVAGAQANVNQAHIEGVNPLTTHCYAVVAYNSFGQSARSNTSCTNPLVVTPTVTSIPTPTVTRVPGT